MKKAVSLIELLLAIVIVGIGVAALPYISITSTKGNAQTILSEVISSSRIYIDDILLQPWNSALATGFIDNSGAKVYSGILKTEATEDARFESLDGKIIDVRDKDTTADVSAQADTKTDVDASAESSAKKIFLYNRTTAKTKDGDIVVAAAADDTSTDCDGLNCAQKKSSIGANVKNLDESTSTASKNAFAFDISAKVNFINIEEKIEDKKITATFNPNSVATGTTNAIMVEVNATAPVKEDSGAPTGNLVDDVSNITLRSFSFNIGSEPQ